MRCASAGQYPACIEPYNEISLRFYFPYGNQFRYAVATEAELAV
ncbi:MAG: hypothetical protein V7642_4891 [Burkholderiales bacterium]|jgi:hypothetical protein